MGAELLQRFNVLILVFAGILIYASYVGFTNDDDEEDEDMDNNFIVKNLRGVLEISPSYDGDKFFTQVDGKWMVTPLLLCLLTIEFSDIVFATDSVPAVLGTTTDPFIAYSSNMFAIVGLRSLFFILKDAMVSFEYLEPAVNLVLGWIGVKIILDYFHLVQIPTLLSLFIVLSILLCGVGFSVLNTQHEAEEKPATEDP